MDGDNYRWNLSIEMNRRERSDARRGMENDSRMIPIDSVGNLAPRSDAPLGSTL